MTELESLRTLPLNWLSIYSRNVLMCSLEYYFCYNVKIDLSIHNLDLFMTNLSLKLNRVFIHLYRPIIDDISGIIFESQEWKCEC